MLVKLVGEITGTRNGEPWPPPGFAFELPDDEAQRLIESHMALPVVDVESGVETAVRFDPAVEKRKATRSALVK